ncbi:DUF7284 family protein [Halomarina rubra]|uniref:Uncharacterized protein n=1 Tax=Halomarina rubra TaxID=2071873 RepID=A0ABD6AV89_9EURY|nr:hypothetical protein [Halomarina rubra]
MRGLSTAVDAVLFCLLVSAAVGVLAVPSTVSAPDPPRAERTAATLATTTLSVPVAVADDTGHRRVARGTPASLLARGALANATLDGRRLAPDTLPRRLGAAVGGALPAANVRVVARWGPYPNASLSGRLAVGPVPPRDAVTDVATVAVPSGVALDRDRARAAADVSVRALATLVAERVVASRFPPGAGRSNLADGAVASRTRTRYERFGAVVGADLDAALDEGAASTARDRLVDALAGRLATDIRQRFETPRQAVDALTLDTVRLVVVRWR